MPCPLLCCVAVEMALGFLLPESKREELQRESFGFLPRVGGGGKDWGGISSGCQSVINRSNRMHFPSHCLHYLFLKVICDGYLIPSLPTAYFNVQYCLLLAVLTTSILFHMPPDLYLLCHTALEATQGWLLFDHGEEGEPPDSHSCGERWPMLPVLVQLPFGLCCTAMLGWDGGNH